MKIIKILLLFVIVCLFGQKVIAQSSCWVADLATDIPKGTTQFGDFIKNDENGFYAYKQLYNAGKPRLRMDADALLAYSKAIKNAKLKEWGFTNELLAQVNGYIDASFADLMNDLTNLTDFAKNNNVEIKNFEFIVKILKGDNQNYRQGVHWIIKDIASDAGTFGGKTITLESPVLNAAGNAASIDVRTSDVPPKFIEYKSGPGSVTKTTIIDQFVKRDLLNVDNLSQLEWRITGRNLTKQEVVGWLSSTEGSDALRPLLNNGKLQSFFPPTILINDINDFIVELSKENIYYAIFKNK